MMNADINFPYPLIRQDKGDYKTTVFEGKLRVLPTSGGYMIYPDFTIKNKEINQLLQDGSLTYAIEVSCSSTLFRKLYRVKNNNSILLEATMVHGNVDLYPCIIVQENVIGFSNDDFADEYENMRFDLHTGDIVAIGASKAFDAIYQNDVMQGSSIVAISGNKKAKRVSCNLEGNIIKVILPLKEFENYQYCGQITKKIDVLNAIYVIPALVYAIDIINEEYGNDMAMDESDYEDKAWYKTITGKLKQLADRDEGKYKKLLEDSFSSAELLLENNSEKAVEFLADIE